jgi:hypothetical protein
MDWGKAYMKIRNSAAFYGDLDFTTVFAIQIFCEVKLLQTWIHVVVQSFKEGLEYYWPQSKPTYQAVNLEQIAYALSGRCSNSCVIKRMLCSEA